MIMISSISFLVQSLRGHLLEELEQAFPDEVEAYRNVRAASAAVSKTSLVTLGVILGTCCLWSYGVFPFLFSFLFSFWCKRGSILIDEFKNFI